jgi:diacylglycerol O-acyltransferase
VNSPPLGNILISNVVGPKQDLYLNGSKLVGLYPISIIPPGVSANITFYTTGGVVYAGIIAGREAIPDLPFVAEQMVRSFDELELAVKKKRQAKKRRNRKTTTKRPEQ